MPIDPTMHARLRALMPRLDHEAVRVVEFWRRHGPDRAHFGFHGSLDRAGRAVAPHDKGVIQTARHLWTFATWHARREPSAEVRAIADGLLAALERFVDVRDGEVVFALSRAGAVVDARKNLYAQAFAIYALSTYAAAFADGRGAHAARLAVRCFDSVDRRVHDPVHMGYDQRRDAWVPGLTPAPKDANTHLHLLEALTALVRATALPLAGARLAELATLFAHAFVRPPGYLHPSLGHDLRPMGAPRVSYGHDLEASWLIADACAALGWPRGHTVARVAADLGERAAREGYDAEHGGYCDEGVPGGAPTRDLKMWWTQAEALPALALRLRDGTGDSRDVARLERTLDFIVRHLVDAEHGEWFTSATAEGALGPHGDTKGGPWKASYHGVRGLVVARELLASTIHRNAWEVIHSSAEEGGKQSAEANWQ